MSEELVGNVLVAQSGGPTSVINSSLAGVITEALNHECIEEIYGAANGILGVLNEDFVDLAEESQQNIRGLRYTPASALGTCRYKIKNTADYDRILEVFEAHNIRYFFYIGGNDSQDTTNQISKLAAERGYDLRAIGIPKTVDNDLPVTDHCPGYGSIIKYVATVVREMAQDHASFGHTNLVSIIEVMGRSAGWVAAGASLAKRKNQSDDAPHIILMPEVAFSKEKFLEDVQRTLASKKFCLVVVGEGLRDVDGNYVSAGTDASDTFGHANLGGAGDFLENLVSSTLGVKTLSTRLGHHQRCASHVSSQADNDEAFMAGEAAVEKAVEGVTGKMITLTRADSDEYRCETGLAELGDVANGIKDFPLEWINEDQISISYQFAKYAQPLIKGEVEVPFEFGLPKFINLDMKPVEKKLASYGLQ